MNSIFLKPSFYAHIMNSLLLLFSFIFIYRNYSKIRNVEPYKLITIILLLSLAVGIHGLSHLGLETSYDYLV
jgi:hypothetical protein